MCHNPLYFLSFLYFLSAEFVFLSAVVFDAAVFLAVIFALLVVGFFVDEAVGFFDTVFFAVSFVAAVFLAVVFALLLVDFLADEATGFFDVVDFTLVEVFFFAAAVADLTAFTGAAFFEVEVSVLFFAAADFPGNAIVSISTREYFWRCPVFTRYRCFARYLNTIIFGALK